MKASTLKKKRESYIKGLYGKGIAHIQLSAIIQLKELIDDFGYKNEEYDKVIKIVLESLYKTVGSK
jgi:hypothetical protein